MIGYCCYIFRFYFMSIVLNNLTKQINYKNIFVPINLSAKAQQVWHVKGANGTGKSTLLKIIAGLLEYQGERIVKCCISYLGHKSGLYSQLTADENIQYAKLWNPSCNNVMLKDWLIPTNKPVSNLSAGQKQSVAIILACNNKQCWLLDEPTHSLDVEKSLQLKKLCIKHIKKNNGIIFFTSHIVNDPLLELVTNDVVLNE